MPEGQTISNSDAKFLSTPIVALLICIVCTYFPLLYTYLPVLGKMKIALLAGIILLVSYLANQQNYRNPDVYRNPIFLAWLGLLGVLILGLLVSLDRGMTLDYIKMNIKYFIVFMVMIKIIDSSRRLDLVIRVFVACGVCMALKTIINYLTGQTSLHGVYTSSRAMSIGIFGDPNDLALLYNVTLPFVLFFLVKAKKKFLPFVGILMIITAIILTFSRGGFLGLCAVGVGFSILYARKRKKYLVFMLMIVLLFWFLAPPEYSERISSIFDWEVDPETGETGTRMDAWRLVIREGLKQPVLGVGAGSSYYVAGTGSDDWHLIHNSFIQIFSESGLLGLFFYLLLFYLPYKQYRAAVRLDHRDVGVHLLRFSMIVVSFFSYGVTIVFLPQAYSPILYTLTGIAIIQAQLISLNNNKTVKKPCQPSQESVRSAFIG